MGILFLSCSQGINILANDGELWSDSDSVSSNLSLSNETVASAPNLSYRSLVETDKVYFRSSDIEFWSIESVSDINSIFSSKYGVVGSYAEGKSLEFNLGDSTESVVFTPFNDYSSVLGGGLNGNWQQNVTDFISAGNNSINLIRLDIGAGQINFIINGEVVDMHTADGGDGNGVDANSIIFTTPNFLSKPLLVTRSMEQEIINGVLNAEDLNLSTDEYAFVQAIHQNANSFDYETMIDVNGALYLPMSTIDILSFNPAINHLKIMLSWDIAGAIHLRDNEYFMDNRFNGRSHNFSLQAEIAEGLPSDENNDDPEDPPIGGVDLSSLYLKYPEDGQSNVYLDQDLQIAMFSPATFDLPSVEASFTINPIIQNSKYLRYFVNEANTMLTIELDSLDANTEYTVTFNTLLELGGTALSEDWSWSFTTGTEREFDVPVLIGRPEFSMTEHFPSSLTYDFSWTPITGAVEYELQETVSEIFASGGSTVIVDGTTFTMTKDYSNQFYYRVRGHNGSGGYSEWSQIYHIEPQL